MAGDLCDPDGNYDRAHSEMGAGWLGEDDMDRWRAADSLWRDIGLLVGQTLGEQG